MLDVARYSRWSRLWIIITIVGGLYLLYMSYFAFFATEIVSETRPTTVQHRCHWKEGDPVVYHLRTKMGVNYDAGHWFHMAENFMVQHSILRSAGELTNSTNVILNFDEGDQKSSFPNTSHILLVTPLPTSLFLLPQTTLSTILTASRV